MSRSDAHDATERGSRHRRSNARPRSWAGLGWLVALAIVGLILVAGARHPSARRGARATISTEKPLPKPRVFDVRTLPSRTPVPARRPAAKPGAAPARTGPPVRVLLPAATRPPMGAQAAATSFLHSYLLISYGDIPVTRLRAAAPRLRRELVARPPEVLPGVRALHPRVTSLSLEHSAGRAWTALAEVADGQRSYLIVCTLTRVGGWQVASLRTG